MTYRAWEQKPLDRAAVRELTAAIAEQAAAQLEEQAMDEAPWSDEKYKAVLAAQQKENALLAGILAARGITDPAEALTLLAGEEELSDPALLTDMDAACQRIWQAIDNGETIAVFGDYDVDGVTATALLYQHLKGMGATVKGMLPSREGDGYGLSKNAIQSMHNKGCTLIVTVDNGISAVEEADFAASLGMDLIITDHHLPPETLPKAVAVVDPRREDDHSPFKGLCGAGGYGGRRDAAGGGEPHPCQGRAAAAATDRPPRLWGTFRGSRPCGQAYHRREYQLCHRAPHQRGRPHG